MRQKPGAQIREDALRQAQRRLEGGCQGCATSYAALAAQHGATRRDFMRYGLGGLAVTALTVASVGVLPKQAEALSCYYTWDCWGLSIEHFATWVIIQTCCEPSFWGTLCWENSIDFTNWTC